jgi:hypothetical protein
MCTIITTVPAPLPQEVLDFGYDNEILLCCFANLQFLVSILPPTIFQFLNLTFPQSLLPLSRNSHDFLGRDVFGTFSRHEYIFWLLTGETPETFNELVDNVCHDILTSRRNGEPRVIEGRPYRVLLVLIWLHKYPSIDVLACIFDISMFTVSATIHQIVPIL